MLNFKKTIVYNIRDLSIHISRYIHAHDEISTGTNPFDDGKKSRISRLQGMSIGFLFMHQGEVVIQKDLEREMSITKSTASGLVHRMVKNGLVYTSPSPNDARVKCLNLTTHAQEMIKEINRQATETEKVLQANISPEDLETFFRVAEQIRKNAQSR
ncbi:MULTISPECIES: MarR family winged helix-turn-helix transcriptional regulator [unclassified Companilactobacillus]|uniref:MarR family winged helix-turn-helix transcriptional regulator n=1 Tax=unclassified Companilactobacillus TaxID=2767904 RepID=UPI002FF1DC9B